MTAKDVIRQSIEMADMMMGKYLEDLDDAAFMRRSVDGMNTIAWQMGHLISSERNSIEAIKPGSCPALPEGFDEKHNKEAAASDDPKAFLTKDEYLAIWKAQRAATMALLESLDDAGPRRPLPRVAPRLLPDRGPGDPHDGRHSPADARRPVRRRPAVAKQADRLVTVDESTRSDVFAPIARAIGAVEPPDPNWADRAGHRQSSLTMPPGALGRLLDLGRQLAAIQRTDRPVGRPRLIAVFAADHGVAAAGVSAYPAEVTGQMVANYLHGGAAVNVLARRAGADVRVADLGVRHLPPDGTADHPGLISRPIRPGTSNVLEGPALTRDEAFRAFAVGLELADRWAGDEGFRAIALGEMGIGNTTTASILVAALTGLPAARVVGRGTGVDDEGLVRKVGVVERALRLHADPAADTWDVLARLGGFEILGLAGLAVGAARHRAVVVLDGFISGVAGLVAARLCPAATGSFVAAHLGPEPGQAVVLDRLGLRPLLSLDLRLGEGTGAALALPLVASAADILRDMATSESAAVSGPVEGVGPESSRSARGRL